MIIIKKVSYNILYKYKSVIINLYLWWILNSTQKVIMRHISRQALTLCLGAIGNPAYAADIQLVSDNLTNLASGLFFMMPFMCIVLLVLLGITQFLDRNAMNAERARVEKKLLASLPSKRTDEQRMKKIVSGIKANEFIFLREYPVIEENRRAIKDVVKRIRSSNMSAVQKEASESLLHVQEQTINSFRELHQIDAITKEAERLVVKKLDEVKARLFDLVNKHGLTLTTGITDIKIPDTYAKQDELEVLRRKGRLLLDNIKDNVDYRNSEDVFRLTTIVEKRLDEVWSDYLSAKSSYYIAEDSVPFINKSQNKSPDEILDNIFNEITSIYDQIAAGNKSSKKRSDMAVLAATHNYFEQR